MKRLYIIAALIVVAVIGGWVILNSASHRHQWVKQTDAQGKVYWTCAMHPQVHQDHPGHCPICGMTLFEKKETEAATADNAAATSGERQPLYWYDPMQPDQHFDKPGKSPFMDMQLVPMYGSDEGGSVQVRIDPQVVQNLGIRTAKVERGDFIQRVDAVGSVEIDERRIVAVESRASGWVEQLMVRAVGDPVTRGQQIAGIYSPDLLAAQQELTLAARSHDENLLAASKQRVSLLGLSSAQIDAVLKSAAAQRRVMVFAPQSGVVTELNVREGQQVTPGTPLMRVADLSRVWINVEVPEAEAGRVHQGGAVEARLAAMPGQSLRGKIDYIYPRVDTQTRTLRARLSFDNPDLALKPGMYANVALLGEGKNDALLVPSEAVIRTGQRTVVILAEAGGKFRPAQVEVGDDRAGQTEIISGVREGETVVVSGQFLIDSEANLRGALTRMSAPMPAGQSGDSQ